MGFLFLSLMVTIATAVAFSPNNQNYLLMPHSGSDIHKHPNLNCLSWRLAVETNNLQDWIGIPNVCVDYVSDYVLGKQYAQDIDLVCAEAYNYAKGLNLTAGGKDVFIFDVDDTILSNVPLFSASGWQPDDVSIEDWVKWSQEGAKPAIPGPLKLYKNLIKLGFKIVFLTTMSEEYTEPRIKNLIAAGFTEWEKLILKPLDNHDDTVVFKSTERQALEEAGYRIRGNVADQWSDLIGKSTGDRTFKLPNPLYYFN